MVNIALWFFVTLLVLVGCGGENAGPSPTAADGGAGAEAGGAGAPTGGQGGTPSDGGGGSGGSGGEGGGTLVPPRVLVLGPDDEGWMTAIQAELLAVGPFVTVDVFHVQGFPFCPSDVVPPTLAELLAYDVVLVAEQVAITMYATFGIGDVLADYYDAGGRVVMTNMWVFGRFTGRPCTASGCGASCDFSEPYALWMPGNWVASSEPDEIGELSDPSSPLLDGVTTLSFPQTLHLGPVDLTAGTEVVASWASDGLPLIVRGEKDGRARVDLNFPAIPASVYPYGWEGDGAVLLRNALLYGWE